MAVKDIALRSFRNHSSSSYEFIDGVNVLWGANGSGKTSVLEGIYLLAYARSFRTSRINETLQSDHDTMSLTGHFVGRARGFEIQLNLLADGRKRYLLNGQTCRGARDLIGLNPVVLLSPEEQTITKGSPNERRSYFDRVFSVVSPPYVESLINYTRALKQRNAALVEFHRGFRGVESVTAWDEILVQEGLKIWHFRRQLIDSFREHVYYYATSFTSDEVKLTLQYGEQAGVTAADFSNLLAANLKRDIRQGYTTTGPHRDQYEFEFNGADIRKFGSQGEHKLSLVLIKMAEAQFIRKNAEKTPTILLDDLFAKLDRKRSEQVFLALGSEFQTIITSTDLSDLEEKGLKRADMEIKSYRLDNT